MKLPQKIDYTSIIKTIAKTNLEIKRGEWRRKLIEKMSKFFRKSFIFCMSALRRAADSDSSS
jgi:hypothetical protein